jgi:hypothetical protein
MSTQIAEAERTVRSATEGAALASCRVEDEDPSEPEHPIRVARGIAKAVLISVPFWALFGFALYLLI